MGSITNLLEVIGMLDPQVVDFVSRQWDLGLYSFRFALGPHWVAD